MALLQIFDPMARPTPIGIDLGTTNSLVAWTLDGRPECLLDCDQEALLPSVVHYGLHGVIVGAEALRKAPESPRETLVSVKRFMGRGADDPETRRLGPYEFIPSGEGSNSVRFKVHDRALTPVEVSAEILKVLKLRAEEKLRVVGGAVITVPAYFDEAQRQATRDAGRLAGLDVLRLINEPTAAALAYGLDKGTKTGTFAVYDLGGGTFDITVLSLDDGVFQVRSTGGDSQLGGDDIDRKIAEVLLSDLGYTHDKIPSPETVRTALTAARELKHTLTTSVSATATLKGITRTVTRDELDGWIAPLLDRTGISCRRALRDADVKPAELDGVILVGGSTRMPRVRSYVQELFGREPLADIDPDQVVALGAALQADMLAGSGPREEALILDVIPLSLGLETLGGVTEKILSRNTAIPAGKSQLFTTYADNQTGFVVHVVQGERELAADNRSLAKFTLKGIPPMAAGMARLEVTFRVNTDGMLTVTARELGTGREQHVEVQPTYGLSSDEVERMLFDSFDHAEADIVTRQSLEKKVEAERVLLATAGALSADSALLDEDERAEVDGAMTALREALKSGDRHAIHRRTEGLDEATRPLAERRMNRAVLRAMSGHDLGEFEEIVKDRPEHPHLTGAESS